MSKKEIYIYYKGDKQTIKYYGKIDENQLKEAIKQIFKIKESKSQIYFQDEEGDILLLNNEIPSGLSVYITVEPDPIPENPSTELNIKKGDENLIKFHWIQEISNDKGVNNELKVIVNKYIYTTVNDEDMHPHVRSSYTFVKGRHFFVLRKPKLPVYSLLLICDENTNFTDYCVHSYQKAIGIFHGKPESFDDDKDDLITINLGILIDMDNKKCIFYDYDKRKKIKIIYRKEGQDMEGYEAPIDFQRAKLLAWIKRDVQNIGKKGITILNEGCIPIPYWVKSKEEDCVVI